jgi:hypothetical protein
MVTAEYLDQRSDQLAQLIGERLGVRGKGLEAKLRHAGRLLPGWARREAARYVEAKQRMGHPRLMQQTDETALEAGYSRVEKWLKSVDPAERRKTRILGFLATNALNLLIITAAFIAWLVWSGHL